MTSTLTTPPPQAADEALAIQAHLHVMHLLSSITSALIVTRACSHAHMLLQCLLLLFTMEEINILRGSIFPMEGG